MFEFNQHRIRHAVWILRHGGIIAYPTEAVYGLGCDPWNGKAVDQLLKLKRRSPVKGLIVIAESAVQLKPFVLCLQPARMEEIFATWPGAVTWLLPAHPNTPRWLTGRFQTLAVRVTAHPLAAALCHMFGGAIVATSANQSGCIPARTALAVRLALDQTPKVILHGNCGGAARPSMIRDGVTGRILRA